jgi:LmbE family N-acetylglucosaminyl deacetylase
MPTDTLRLMCIVAHPDDESLGLGGILAKYAAEGVETFLVTATRGQRGWSGEPGDNPGLAALGQIRDAELRCAAQTLGVGDLQILDYIDGDLDQVHPAKIIHELVAAIRRARPHVIVTFDPSGAYGHPDHIAISQHTIAAAVTAADSAYVHKDQPKAYRVPKMYYMMASQAMNSEYQKVFGNLVMTIDGVDRRMLDVQDWMITTVLDTTQYWEQVWAAVRCHKTQIGSIAPLITLSDEGHRKLWGLQEFTRVYSTVNGGRTIERDLFEGLR